MIISELKEELKKNNINEKACLIYPSLCIEGALCLCRENDDSWSVTLNERGEYRVKEKFYTENDACRFFFMKVISDPTYRNDFQPSDLLEFLKRKKDLLKKYGYE